MQVPQPCIGLDPSSSGNHQVSLVAYLEGEAGGQRDLQESARILTPTLRDRGEGPPFCREN